MKIFNDYNTARDSLENKQKFWLNSECPFMPLSNESPILCGTWCALCYVHVDENNNARYVLLGCKGTDKKLYVD